MSEDTKDRILDAAEHLFATQGVAATSLRAIMKTAGANMAAVHYHFGSRAGLLEALIARRAAPVNDRRIAILDELEARHPHGPLPAVEIARAFFLPAIDMIEDPAHAHVARLIGRLAMETGESEAMGRVFGTVLQRFLAAIRRAAPHLSEDEARRRIHFMVGAMVFALCVPRPAMTETPPARMRDVVDDLITFTAAGLMAAETHTHGKDTP